MEVLVDDPFTIHLHLCNGDIFGVRHFSRPLVRSLPLLKHTYRDRLLDFSDRCDSIRGPCSVERAGMRRMMSIRAVWLSTGVSDGDSETVGGVRAGPGAPCRTGKLANQSWTANGFCSGSHQVHGMHCRGGLDSSPCQWENWSLEVVGRTQSMHMPIHWTLLSIYICFCGGSVVCEHQRAVPATLL